MLPRSSPAPSPFLEAHAFERMGSPEKTLTMRKAGWKSFGGEVEVGRQPLGQATGRDRRGKEPRTARCSVVAAQLRRKY